MAKIRDIKKDIHYLCEQLLTDTLEVAEMTDEQSKPKALELMIRIAAFHNDLISRANHPDGKDNPRLVKKYYHDLANDLLSGCNRLYGEMAKLIPENPSSL